MRLVYHLEGLDCAGCAAKIELAASKLKHVDQAVVDFSSSRIFLDTEHPSKQEIQAALQEVVSTLEPHIVVSEQRPSVETPNLLTFRNLMFTLGLLSFLVGVFVPAGFGQNTLYVLAHLLAGYEVMLQALRNIRQGQIFDENFLMTVATVGALVIGEFPEAASVMIFYRTGEFLQSLAVDHSRRSISALIAIRPETAHRKLAGTISTIPVDHVRVGDILEVRPGERIPVDGLILEGFSSLDTSALTGESLPKNVEPGEPILAGAINLNGLLTIEASKLAADSGVSRILDLVENASANKAPTEDFITTFARYYTPVVVAIAALIASIPPLFFGGVFQDWFYRALVFLVISCPCALVVSIPLGFFGGIGRSSRHGVLVKGSNYLQALNEAKTIVFDKTGTLTSGQFSVQSVYAASPFTETQVLELAAYAESVSSHPIARSIVQAYGQPIQIHRLGAVEELAGLGLKAKVDDWEILIGSERLLSQAGIEVNESLEPSSVYVAINGVYAGAITIFDQPKPSSAKAIAALKNLGLSVVMLTGDSKRIATQVGQELGIGDIRAELLPEQKLAELEGILAQTRGKAKVIFVGDGINDAPALARAHVGVAMGALGSEAAIETADVVLMTDDPHSVVDALTIAKRTNQIVWQNIALAFTVKLLVLILGGFGLASLWEAVFADVGVTILAVLNSVRILTSNN